MKRTKEIFKKLKAGHLLWIKHDADFKARLEKAFDPLFIELEQLGVARHFAEALLFFGHEFVSSLNKDMSSGVSSNSTVEDTELIYGVKATKMSDRATREAKLAKKHNALVYKSAPMVGDKVKIRVLTYKKK